MSHDSMEDRIAQLLTARPALRVALPVHPATALPGDELHYRDGKHHCRLILEVLEKGFLVAPLFLYCDGRVKVINGRAERIVPSHKVEIVSVRRVVAPGEKVVFDTRPTPKSPLPPLIPESLRIPSGALRRLQPR